MGRFNDENINHQHPCWWAFYYSAYSPNSAIPLLLGTLTASLRLSIVKVRQINKSR